eukprot:PhF_6_TR22387/c0_g1_i1/m.31762
MLVSHALLGAKEGELDPLHNTHDSSRMRRVSPPRERNLGSTLVGRGTRGLGPACEHQLAQMSRERFEEWKRQKDMLGIGVPKAPPPPVNCRSFYDRTKQHHEEVKQSLERIKVKQAVEFMNERKSIQTYVKKAKEDSEMYRKQLVQEEKERRKLLREEALEKAKAEKEKAILEEQEKTEKDREMWQAQHEVDLETRAAQINVIKQKRSVDRNFSVERRSEQEEARLKAIQHDKDMLKRKMERSKILIGENKLGRQDEVNRLREMEKRGKEMSKQQREHKQEAVRSVIHEMREEQKKFKESRKGQSNLAGNEAAKQRKEQETRVKIRIELMKKEKHKHALEWKASKQGWMTERQHEMEKEEEWHKQLVQDMRSPRFSPRSPES